MKLNDALNILGLSGIADLDAVKTAYRKACSKYHPDRNPGGLEIMKAVNAAYQSLKDYLAEHTSVKNTYEQTEYGDFLANAINAVIDLYGLDIEICGSWVWVGGNTKEHKDTLKEHDFKWSKQKAKWYYRPAGFKSRSRGRMSMDEIRGYYGSQHVANRADDREQLR